MSDAAGTAATGAATTTDAGAADAGQAAATTAAAGTEQAQATDATQAGAQQVEQQTQAQQAGGLDWSQVPAEYRAAFEEQHNRNHRLQQENGSERIQAKAQARDEGAMNALRELAKSMGFDLPGDEVTIEQVQSELGTVTTARDKAAAAAAINEAAWTADVDRSKLGYLKYQLSEDTSLPAPSDPEYAAKVSAAVAALVAADPTLRRSGTVAAAGVENHGGANGNDISQEQFNQMTMSQKTELFNSNPDAYRRLAG